MIHLQGSWPADDLRRAFVSGAQWWEFHQTSATMWQSDRNLAEEEADRRYPNGNPQESMLEDAAMTYEIDAHEAAELAADSDAAFQNERADAFNAHCDDGHNADFEVCTNPRCRAVVVEEIRRGLLNPGYAWPPIESDDKPLSGGDILAEAYADFDAWQATIKNDMPDYWCDKWAAMPIEMQIYFYSRERKHNYIPIYICLLMDDDLGDRVAGVLSDYGAAVNWLDADRDNRALLMHALNKLSGEYAMSEEPAK